MPEVFLIQGLPVEESVVTSFLKRRSVNFGPKDHPLDLADYATQTARSNPPKGYVTFISSDFGVWYDETSNMFILGFDIGKSVETHGDYEINKVATTRQLKTQKDFIYSLGEFGFKPSDIGTDFDLYILTF